MVVRPEVAPTSTPLRALGRRALDGVSLLAFGVLPAVVLLTLVAGSEDRSFDFQVFWAAGRDVLAGTSPYPAADARVLQTEHEFVYPPAAAVAMAPLAALPLSVAAPLYTLLVAVSAFVALRLCGVTDWRLYGLAAISAPLGKAIALGTVTPFILLGLAALWRYRDRSWVAGLVVCGLILMKLFLWPLVIWLLATRRVRAAGVAAAGAAVLATASWAVLGFAGLADYPRLLGTLSDVLQGKGYSLTALGLAAGLGSGLARASALALGLAGLAALAVAARRGAREWGLFVAAVAAALALSPIVWSHYFVLLLVPIAVVQPRLGWLWGVFALFWLVPGQSALPPLWEGTTVAPAELPLTPRVGDLYLIVLGVALAAVVLLAAGRAAPPPRTRPFARDGIA